MVCGGVEPGILILSPVVTARMGLQRSEKCQKGIERKEEKLMLEKLAYSGVLGSVGLSMKKSLQVRLNRRVTFDRRIKVPPQGLF